MLLELHVRQHLSCQRRHDARSKHSSERFEFVFLVGAFPWTAVNEVTAEADQDEKNAVDDDIGDDDGYFDPVALGDRAVSNFHGFQSGENLPLASIQSLEFHAMNDPSDDEEDDRHDLEDDHPNCHVLANALSLLFWYNQKENHSSNCAKFGHVPTQTVDPLGDESCVDRDSDFSFFKRVVSNQPHPSKEQRDVVENGGGITHSFVSSDDFPVPPTVVLERHVRFQYVTRQVPSSD